MATNRGFASRRRCGRLSTIVEQSGSTHRRLEEVRSRSCNEEGDSRGPEGWLIVLRIELDV